MHKSFVFAINERARVSLAGATMLFFLSVAFAVEPPPGGFYPEENTALGKDALFNYLTGGIGQNVAIGYHALYNNSFDSNTAVGWSALSANTAGEGNTGLGWGALHDNTTGRTNTAVGTAAMFYSTTGWDNTAIGWEALEVNTSGYGNVAMGVHSLGYNSTGSRNTGIGGGSLGFNNVGNDNTALGSAAMNFITTGSNNIAIGRAAGVNITSGNNNIVIGNEGKPGESDAIRIGNKQTHRNTSIAGINGVTVPNGVAVIVDRNGHLGTATSSVRYKEAIQPMHKASEAILALNPVTFRYKEELDPEKIQQFGLVAEDVEKVNPDLVARDEEGKPYTVRYEAVNAMLLNEFLKAHAKLEAQGKEIAELKAALKEQAAQIQKVNARLETSASATATRMVEN